MVKITKIENSILEFYNNHWIIWKNHNKDYTQGSYYRLNCDGSIDLIIETLYDCQVIQKIDKNVGENNDKN